MDGDATKTVQDFGAPSKAEQAAIKGYHLLIQAMDLRKCLSALPYSERRERLRYKAMNRESRRSAAYFRLIWKRK